MRFSRFFQFLLPLGLVLISSCAGNTVATLRANVAVEGDTTGENSAFANINFLKFNQPPGPAGNDTNLRMTFSNDDGDTMSMVLAPQSGSFPANVSYTFDGTSNTFTASFGATTGGGTNRNFTVTSTNGFLNIRSISIVNQTLQALEGDFRVNLEMDGAKAGAADGTISYSSK